MVINLPPAYVRVPYLIPIHVLYIDNVPGYIERQCHFDLLGGSIAYHGAAEFHLYSNGIRFLWASIPLATVSVVAIHRPAWEIIISGTPFWLTHLGTGGHYVRRVPECPFARCTHTLGWSIKLGDCWKLCVTVPKTAADSDLNLSSLCTFARPTAKAMCVRWA